MNDGAIGIIGGSGLYELEGLTEVRWRRVRTPFGDPSDEFRRHHSAIVLVGDHDFVAPGQVQPQDHRLQGLGRIAGDRHFLRVAPEVAGQVAPDAFHPGLQHPPHVIHRQLVTEPKVPDHRFEDMGGAGTAAPVVEVHHRAVSIEGPLNLEPEGFVVGQGGG